MENKIIRTVLIAILILSPILSFCQDKPKIVDTSIFPRDTTKTKPWQVGPADSSKIDTVGRFRHYDFDDSVRACYLSPRLDQSRLLLKTQWHDAGDFLRFNPSDFIIDYQPFPMRKTVAPFGLPGDRINLVYKDRAIFPLEHLPEPDNQRGFEELPTAAVQEIYNIEGPLGMVYGGNNAVSSLILLPTRPKSSRAESQLSVDIGDFSYSNTRVAFTERAKSGRLIQIGVEHRRGGEFTTWEDSSYHYWADIVYPLNSKLNIKFGGRQFRRQGEFPLRPSMSAVSYNRSRRDRDFFGGWNYSFSPESKIDLELRHQRNEAEIDNSREYYKSVIDNYENSARLTYEYLLGGINMRTRLILTEEQFNVPAYKRKRHRAQFNMAALTGDSAKAVIGYAGVEKVGGYDPAPSGMISFNMNHPRLYIASSVGYSTKFPRQYELDLPPVTANLLNLIAPDYYESGNGQLKPEKQLVGNLKIGMGKTGDDLSLSLTGGKIFDAIDWVHYSLDSLGQTLTAFKPENRDIEFANATLAKKLVLSDYLFWYGGGSYRYLTVNGDENPPYAPDYQLFSALELHYYFKPFDMHLYGYVETSYIGRYHTYDAFGESAVALGEKLVTNVKLSFSVSKFRFYYYWQNLLSTEYTLRDRYGFQDRLLYYGFTWQFLD